MRRWLNDCLTGHEVCRSNQHGYERPTRLVFLGEKSTKARAHCEGGGSSTISHFEPLLGKEKLFQADTGKFSRPGAASSRRRAFPDVQGCFLHYPETGFNYIWIDSLCIIQDDLEDRHVETSKMSSVYGGSTLNLAASAARDGLGGCFFDRDQQTIRTISQYLMRIPGDDTLHECLDPDTYRTCMEYSPLSKCGWAFKERFLAPRTVNFTNGSCTGNVKRTWPVKLTRTLCLNIMTTTRLHEMYLVRCSLMSFNITRNASSPLPETN
jgi:hypothetical protein